MSEDKTPKSVNNEMASHSASPVADKGCLQALEALVSLYETQQPVNLNRVSLTPSNFNASVGDEDKDSVTDIAQAHQSSGFSDDASDKDTGTVDGTENLDEETVQAFWLDHTASQECRIHHSRSLVGTLDATMPLSKCVNSRSIDSFK